MSKQDVSAVAEQGSSLVVENPVEGSATTEPVVLESSEPESGAGELGGLATPEAEGIDHDTPAAEASAQDGPASPRPPGGEGAR